MKKHYHFFFFCVFALLFQTKSAIAQTLGTYPNTTVVAGQNTTVTPGVHPAPMIIWGPVCRKAGSM